MDTFLAMGFLIFAIVAFVVLMLPFVGGLRVGGRAYTSAEAFAKDTAWLTGLDPSSSTLGQGKTLDHVVFTGHAGTRRASIEYERHVHPEAGSSARVTYTGHVAVAADPAASLDVTRETVFTHLGQWLGISSDARIGDAAFDGRYWVKTPDQGRAIDAMDRGLKEHVETLFERFGIEQMSIGGGHLRVSFPAARIDPHQYARLLDLLDRAASAFDRIPVMVRALGGERRAFRDARGAARCAYCHDGIDGDEPNLVACERCHTVLHGDCWRELGRCPLLGCQGKDPERTQVR